MVRPKNGFLIRVDPGESVVAFSFLAACCLLLYSVLAMAVKSIQLGQVWRNDQTDKNYLVTKVYSEVFAQYAMLRPADATASQTDTVRIKIQKSADGATLPGYTFTQESQF